MDGASVARLHFRNRTCGIDGADPDHCKNRTRRPLSFTGLAHAMGISRDMCRRQLVSGYLRDGPTACYILRSGDEVVFTVVQATAASCSNMIEQSQAMPDIVEARPSFRPA